VSVVGVIQGSGQPVVNVIDVDVDTEDPPGRSEELLEDVARDVLNNWQDDVLDNLGNNYLVQGAQWIDLDSEDGATGQFAADSGKNTEGQVAGAQCPPNVAFLVHKLLQGSSRGTRNGRMYLPQVAEAAVDDSGNLQGTYQNDINTSMENFKDGINGVVIGDLARVQNLCVVHTPEGEDPSQDHISTFECDPRAATMRRRMR